MKKLLLVAVIALFAYWQFGLHRDGRPVGMLAEGEGMKLPDTVIDIRDEDGKPVDLASLPPEVRDAILRQAGAEQGGGNPALPPGAARSKEPVKEFSFRERNSTHTSANVSGWTVILERALSDSNTALANRVLTRLEKDLDGIAEKLPPTVVTELRAVPIWINLNSPSPRAGQYHWSAEGARSVGEDPQKAGGVEIARAGEYLEMAAWEQPSFILHELAHAWQHRRFGVDYPPLRAAYQQALASGIYNAVKHVGGDTDRAYAMTDEREYFAELTEAYFGKNDFYPFTRDELRSHDPAGYRMIENAWSGR